MQLDYSVKCMNKSMLGFINLSFIIESINVALHVWIYIYIYIYIYVQREKVNLLISLL